MVEEKMRMVCITCPVGCSLEVNHDGKVVIKVEGQQCKKGIAYAKVELTDPRRMVTTTVKVRDGLHPLVPVCISATIPKHLIYNVLEELRKVEVQAPVVMGQVILEDVFGTGVKVIASRTMPVKKQH